MKRILTVLILVMSGSLLIAVSQSPGDAYAADPTDEYLVVDDGKDDLVESLFDKNNNDGSEGDPDSLIDGLEDLEKSTGSDIGSSFLGIDGLTIGDLWIFIATTVVVLP